MTRGEAMNSSEREYIDVCAEAAHEANRAYCASLGDHSQVPWAEAPEWQRQSCRLGVRGVESGNTPEQSHESWLREKQETGWKYGPIKDVEAKTHPCFRPYSELPPEQRVKDLIFVSVVRGLLSVLAR
jgi:hypothetical protein